MLEKLWDAAAGRYDLRGLIVTSIDGVRLRTLTRGEIPDIPSALLGAVARDAPKMRLGTVRSTTVYFDHVCLFCWHCDDFLLTFISQNPVPQDVAKDFASILSVRELSS